MKISKMELVRFLDLIQLKGDVESKEALLNVSKDNITVSLFTPTKVLALTASITGIYDNLGEIGINDLPLFRKLVSSVEAEDIDLSIKDNKLTVSGGNTKVLFRLTNTDYILNKLDFKKFCSLFDKAKGNEFSLTKINLKKISDNLKAIGSNTLELVGENKTINVKAENNENEIISSITVEDNLEKFNTCIAKFLGDIFDVIGGEVKVSMKSECPISISFKQDNIVVDYVVAPYQKK